MNIHVDMIRGDCGQSIGVSGRRGSRSARTPDTATTNLTFVSTRRSASSPTPAHWAHDARNLLTTIGLHIDTLAHLCGRRGTKADAGYALITKVCGICNAAVGAEERSYRDPFDIAVAARHVVDLLAPLGPDGFAFNLMGSGPHLVLADCNEMSAFCSISCITHS
jgi:hypothetical protein